MADYPIYGDPTSFEEIYNRFFGKITDDMYMEWTKEDTIKDLYNILMDAIPGFEFPRFPLYDWGVSSSDTELEDDDIINLDEEQQEEKPITEYIQFNSHLTSEEVNILAMLMYNTWLQRQIASIENTRMKYSGSDFKLTSQANHLSKLITLKQEAERQTHHMQRLYKRRKLTDNEGHIKSNWSTLGERSVFDD